MCRAITDKIDEWISKHPSKRNYQIDSAAGFSSDKPTVYSKIKWYGRILTSCKGLGGRDWKVWIRENWKSLAFSCDSQGHAVVYAIVGYVVFTVNGLPYAQALCVPLSTSPQSSFCKTRNGVVVEDMNTLPEKLTVVSLFRLHVATGIPMLYRSGAVVFKTMVLCCRQAIPIGHVELFEDVFEEKDRRSTRSAQRRR